MITFLLFQSFYWYDRRVPRKKTGPGSYGLSGDGPLAKRRRMEAANPGSRVCRICEQLFSESVIGQINGTYYCLPCKSRRYQGLDNPESVRSVIRREKIERGCCVCGYRDSFSALHFDHINPSSKSFSLSRTNGRSMDEVRAEMAKCTVMCANCHAVRSHEERHGAFRRKKSA